MDEHQKVLSGQTLAMKQTLEAQSAAMQRTIELQGRQVQGAQPQEQKTQWSVGTDQMNAIGLV
eukprot:314649-Amphidinium_carterae.1